MITTIRQCTSKDCENEAGTLQCPTCQKAGLESFFCSQDCFKRNWVIFHLYTSSGANNTNNLQSDHKTIHKSQSNFLRNLFPPKVISEPDPDTGTHNPFPTFSYTGSLRPVYPLSETRVVPSGIPKPEYWKDGIARSEQTISARNKAKILTEKEQAGMRKVCRLAREVLDLAAAALKPGVTTDYIDEVVHNACIERKVSMAVCERKPPLTITVISVTTQLLQLPQVSLYVHQRDHLPRHSR